MINDFIDKIITISSLYMYTHSDIILCLSQVPGLGDDDLETGEVEREWVDNEEERECRKLGEVNWELDGAVILSRDT